MRPPFEPAGGGGEQVGRVERLDPKRQAAGVRLRHQQQVLRQLHEPVDLDGAALDRLAQVVGRPGVEQGQLELGAEQGERRA